MARDEKDGTSVKPVRNEMSLNKVTLLAALLVSPFAPAARGQCFHGDFDGSGDVGKSDVGALVDCLSLSGPGGGREASCGRFDFDADRDVDLRDFSTFQRIFGVTSGPGRQPLFHGRHDRDPAAGDEQAGAVVGRKAQ